MQNEVQRKVQQDDEDRSDARSHQLALRAIELREQDKLDAVEQKRTNNVYAQSCRKAVALDPSFPISVNTEGCTPEQLRLEQEAENRQRADAAFTEVEKNNKANTN